MPRTIVAGNWKMHKTEQETAAFLEAFLPRVPQLPGDVEIVLIPPFTSIPFASKRLKGTRVRLGGRTMLWELQGAYTGEISAPMLLELGAQYVLLGHSERRAYCNESDRTVNLKIRTALELGITPIVAVGETPEERDAGLTDDRIIAQTRSAFDGIARGLLGKVVMAYEPVWAIGTGKNCDPGEADRVMALMRTCIAGLEQTPILYGGSMKPENVGKYMERPNVNGGLVGGASLDPAGF